MTNTPAPPPLTAKKVSTVLNAILDNLLGDLIDSPRVLKLVSWACITAGAVWHSSLGQDISTALVSGGLLGHVVSTSKG
jgi:hypothetical protein